MVPVTVCAGMAAQQIAGCPRPPAGSCSSVKVCWHFPSHCWHSKDAGRRVCWHGACMGSCSVCSKGLQTLCVEVCWHVYRRHGSKCWQGSVLAWRAYMHGVLQCLQQGLANCVVVCWHVCSQRWHSQGAGGRVCWHGACNSSCSVRSKGLQTVCGSVLACLQSVLACKGCWHAKGAGRAVCWHGAQTCMGSCSDRSKGL
jgi:hypothetical protein